MAAFVYLIKEEPYPGESSVQWTKIGYSKNPPEWRLSANLKRGNPRNLKLAKVYEYPSIAAARAAERSAHDAFSEFAHQKEWFRIPSRRAAAWFKKKGAKPRK